jgi:hypothetical protein
LLKESKRLLRQKLDWFVKHFTSERP